MVKSRPRFFSLEKGEIFALGLGIFPLAYWAYHHLHADVWYDEAYSLENFILTDLQKTVTDYSAPNNHIFFNLVYQLITRVFQIRTIGEAVDQVYLLRSVQICVSVLIGFYAYIYARNLFKLEKHPHLTIVLLCTTIPFLNFSLQLRGYLMSGLFLIMLLYHSWAFLASSSRKDSILIFLSTTLLLYTIPSNLYTLAAVAGAFGLLFLHAYFTDRSKSAPYFKVIVRMILGGFAAVVLYAPVLKDVVSNRFVDEAPENILYSLGLFPQVMTAFTSGRFLLLIPVLFGGWGVWKSRDTETRIHTSVLLFVITVPFFLAFLHQTLPFQRVFFPLVPLFSLLIATALSMCLNLIQSKRFNAALISIVYLYCVGTALHEMQANNEEVVQVFAEDGTAIQNIYQSYYLSDVFDQNTSMQILKEATRKGVPVVVFDQMDRVSTNLYLSAYDIRYRNANTLKKLRSFLHRHKKALVLTSNPETTLQTLHALGDYSTSILTPEPTFSNVIFVQEQQQDGA